MNKPTPTRTYSRPHFEDLDPHRFEDLVRQLAYEFRRWSTLEALGRSGDDGGVDIRGIESPIDDDPSAGAGDSDISSPVRSWLFQVKREKRFGPSSAANVASAAMFDESDPPFGFVLAVPADVSRRTRDILRSMLEGRGISQVIVWSRSELEDLLFDPKHDHLLFAYFGISLATRRRNLQADLRRRLATKRQIFNLLGDVKNRATVPVLLRDPTEDDYPFRDRVTDWNEQNPAWMNVAFRHHTDPAFVALIYRRYPAWISEDRRSYDVLEQCSHLTPADRRQAAASSDHDAQSCRRIRQFMLAEVPDNQRAHVEHVGWIPMDELLLIDDLGDAFNPPPHLLVRRAHEHGFFTRVRQIVTLDPLRSSRSSSNNQWFHVDDLHRQTWFPDPLPNASDPAD